MATIKVDIETLQYPIGHYVLPPELTPAIRNGYIRTIGAFPDKLSRETTRLKDGQLDTPYREGGWTIRQVTHHCADSHLNALARFKFALTETDPAIKPYFEDRWATLPDATMPVEASLMILEGVHRHWTHLMNHLTEDQWRMGFFHPQKNRLIPLNEAAGSYAWHGEHHLAHITRLKERMAWP